MKSIIFIAAIALAPQIVQADTVQEGRTACRNFVNINADMSGVELANAGKCAGMADGTIQVMVYNCSLGANPLLPKAAPPPSVGAAAQAFLNWADAHPELWGERFADGMIAAAMETFPCEN